MFREGVEEGGIKAMVGPGGVEGWYGAVVECARGEGEGVEVSLGGDT